MDPKKPAPDVTDQPPPEPAPDAQDGGMIGEGGAAERAPDSRDGMADEG